MVLELTSSFVKAICALYIEKHKPKQYMALKSKNFANSPETQWQRSVLTRDRSFFDLINSQEGFLSLQSYFIKLVLLLEREFEASLKDEGITKNGLDQVCVEVGVEKFVSLMSSVIKESEDGCISRDSDEETEPESERDQQIDIKST